MQIGILVQSVVKEFLEDLSVQKAPGPSPSFNVFDLWRAIELIAKKGLIGRGRLAEELGIGEGTVRTLIGRLANSGIIATSRFGCSLTRKGFELWNRIQLIVPQKVMLPENDLTFAAHNVALLLKNRGDCVSHGLEQRDAAVAVGAKGAITLIFKDDKLVAPMVSDDLARDFPKAFNQIIRSMNPEENDVVVIGSADTPEKAEYGALAAAWTLI